MTKEHIILSKGHRNPQGLTVKNNIIISSEHGPVGGDEINNIKFNNNYGWPLASYGEPEMNRKNEFKKSHSENGFTEPIFTFIPSVGLSELIYLPNTFHDEWNDNLIVCSLNGKHLFDDAIVLHLNHPNVFKTYKKKIFYNKILKNKFFIKILSFFRNLKK